MTEKRRCFVIMPFSQTTKEHTEEYWTKHFTEFLKPLIEQNRELEAYRSEALREDILKGIITSLVRAHIVVADLTDYNYNVFWELGVRQSFKHGTVTIAEEGTKFPFDLGAKSTLKYYPKNHLKNKEFEKKFLQAITDCIEHPERSDSHVLETISGRGTIYEIIKREDTIRRLDALVSECVHNLEGIKACEEIAEENLKKETYLCPTTRFRSHAIELLVINRYIDEEVDFYTLSEDYMDTIISMNDQLNMWQQDPKDTNKWILNRADGIKEMITDFEAAIKPIQDTILKKR